MMAPPTHSYPHMTPTQTAGDSHSSSSSGYFEGASYAVGQSGGSSPSPSSYTGPSGARPPLPPPPPPSSFASSSRTYTSSSRPSGATHQSGASSSGSASSSFSHLPLNSPLSPLTLTQTHPFHSTPNTSSGQSSKPPTPPPRSPLHQPHPPSAYSLKMGLSGGGVMSENEARRLAAGRSSGEDRSSARSSMDAPVSLPCSVSIAAAARADDLLPRGVGVWSQSPSKRAPLGPVVLFVTVDGSTFHQADVSGSDCSAAIREKVFTAVRPCARVSSRPKCVLTDPHPAARFLLSRSRSVTTTMTRSRSSAVGWALHLRPRIWRFPSRARGCTSTAPNRARSRASSPSRHLSGDPSRLFPSCLRRLPPRTLLHGQRVTSRAADTITQSRGA